MNSNAGNLNSDYYLYEALPSLVYRYIGLLYEYM